MQLKHKIVALGILPLVLAIAVICALVISLNRQLGDQQAQLIEDSILASKRAELKNYVEMAQSLIAPLYDDGHGDAHAQQQVLEELRKLSFGINGYFFVYDHEGRSLMHARQSDLVGQYLWDMKDPHGLPVIQALLKSAQSGEGFQRYAWNKPSSGQVTDKLAYVVMLDRWGWMLGTGIYLEDVERATQQARAEVAQGIRKTMMAIAVVALVAVLFVFATGMTLNVSEHRLADKKLQRLTQRIVSLQEEERSRVSRELHDGISQVLVSIKFQFELASHVLENGQDKGLGILRDATERLGQAIGEVRSLPRPALVLARHPGPAGRHRPTGRRIRATQRADGDVQRQRVRLPVGRWRRRFAVSYRPGRPDQHRTPRSGQKRLHHLARFGRKRAPDGGR
jgi:two-component system NarL family sensor kinase